MGPERAGVATLAALPRGLPPLSVPGLSLDTLRQLLPIAVALALLSLTEALSIARALALKTGQRLDSDQEFIGQGLANVTGAFFSSYPSSGSFNRSGLNLESGARTPLAAVFSALLLALIVQFVAPVAAYLPLAAMAGVLFLVAWGLIDFHLIAHVLRTDRHEAAVLIGTFLATLFLTLEFAIFVGVLMSLMLYLNRTSRPVIEDVKPAVGKGLYHFSPSPGLPDCPQLKILRINGSIFFGAINHVQRAVQEVDEQTPTQKFLLLACPGVNFVDFAGSEMLAQEAQRRRNLGGELLMCALRDGPIRQLSQIGGKAPLRPDSLFALGDAHTMRSVVHRLDPGVCARCTKRVFEQCPPASRARQATELARATQRDN
ncbi:MAG: SulP family inorganic anion transporter [Burkholderiales bacterium]|nr:SulP family inorganic anion transporter [Burkholderiales bacterium]